MNIQPITSVKAPVFTGKVITNKTYVTKPMKSDSFESSKENFDLDKSMKILSDVLLNCVRICSDKFNVQHFYSSF